MSMEKRALLAIVISMLILLLLPSIMPKPKPIVIKKDVLAQIPKETPQKIIRIERAPLPFEKEIAFETADYKAVLSNLGGVVKSITLKKHLDSADKPIVLASAPDPRDSIFAITGLDPEFDKGIPFSFVEKPDRVVFKAGTQSGLIVEKEIIFRPGKYTIELKQTIMNNTSQARALKYKITGGCGITDISPSDAVYVEVVRNVSGKITNVNKNSIKSATTWNGGQAYWVSLKNRYFSLILKPPVSFTNVFSNTLSNKELETGVETPDFNIDPNSSVTQDFVLYAGPNDFNEIRSLKLGLEDSLNLGFTGGIGRWLFVALEFFESIVKNWGLAIIILTILINVVLFPLTFKSLKSMKQMQALQPKIEALRAAHKDNPQKVNKEIMEVYRKYKINPLGGCLPMLLQMPVFFALYQVLMRSIELRGAPFLWIKDLSQPDRLIASIPIFPNELNILPLLMAVAMFLQQKLSTPPKSASAGASDQMAQQQRMMMVMMPVLFGVLFYKLPSGLVLYWLVNTILTIVEQGLFLKPHLFHVEHLEN
ncbi:MAG: membrane protein insertase YidC [Candidatus Omnitrophota bacterium]|nr:membrane protein insertase YidC [Candidatus Omnitrophota bacterium]